MRERERKGEGRVRKREKKRERERDISVREKHQSVAILYPNQGSNPQPTYVPEGESACNLLVYKTILQLSNLARA